MRPTPAADTNTARDFSICKQRIPTSYERNAGVICLNCHKGSALRGGFGNIFCFALGNGGGIWYRHSQSKGGAPVDFVMEFFGKSFTEAVELVTGEKGAAPPPDRPSPAPISDFRLPPRSDTAGQVKSYLTEARRIDEDVSGFFFSTGDIYEEAAHHNAVFVGRDEDGVPRYAHQRGTAGSFRLDVKGSDKAFNFCYRGEGKRLFVFEAPIDLLSFLCLFKKDWQKQSYLSLGGVGEKALLRFLSDRPNIKTVYLCLDNDNAGNDACSRLAELVPEGLTVHRLMFKVVSVFDVSQTAGKPLPQLAADLSGNVQQYEVFIEALRRASPVPMEIKPVARDTDGFFSIKAQSITIRAGMSEVQTVCAAVHEIAHAKLHDYEHMTELADDGETILVPGEKSRNTEEVEAESISYAVCQYYGIETGENSFGYIATWSKGKELKELRASLETINKTASELITDIDRHFAEICKERGINREEVSATQTDEALYLVDGSVYLHVQHTDVGWDYSLYDKESKKLLDGGVIDSSAIEDSPVASVAGAVRTEVFAIQGMTPTKVTFADMKILEDLQEAQITPPLDSEQITGAVVVPTDDTDTMLPELEQATPMPDPTLTVDDMRSYGYLDSDMLPLSKDRALELLEHDITVYMLHPSNTEEMVFEAEDIIKHDGMFGITRPDWDAVKGHIPPRDVEQRFLNSPTDAMAIYQLRRDAPVELRFANLGSLAAPPDPANYEAVYTREVYPDDDTGRILENFYYIFNDERPGDFVGHSLSVSDIVALKQDGKVSKGSSNGIRDEFAVE